MNISELLKPTAIDREEIEYAVKLSSKEYFKECLLKNEIKSMTTLKELILNKTFKKLNLICVISKTDNEMIKQHIRVAREIIEEDIKNLFNQIERNLQSGTEII